MKIKKVLAGALAAAMALTTMVTTSFTASADVTSILNGEVVIGEWDTSAQFTADKFSSLDFDGSEYMLVSYYSQNLLNEYYCAMKFATIENYASVLEPAVPNVGSGSAITIAFPITAAYSSIATDGLQIQGYDVTITDVKIADNINAASISTGSTVIGEWDTSAQFTADKFSSLDFDGSEYMLVSYYSQNILNEYYCAMKFATIENYASVLEPAVPNVGSGSAITIAFPITAAYSSIATDGLQIQGYDVTITDVTIIDDVEMVATSYDITVAEAENGTVSVDKTTAAEGDTVTITAKAAEGYEVDTITVTGDSGDVEVAEDGTFKMPAEAVTVTAAFKAVESDEPTDDNPTDDNPTDDNPTDDNPADDKPTSGEAVTYDPVVPDTTVSFVPANSAKKFEITDPVTGKTISTSVNKLAKALSKLTEGSDLAFDTGSFGIVLRKNVIKEIVDNDLTLTVKTSKATFIIDAENLAKVKTINIPAIMKTSNFKKLVKEGNTFNVIVTEKNKVEIELA